jgi:hypothetical protein
MVMKERYSGNMIGFCRSLSPEATPDLELKCSSHSVVGGEDERNDICAYLFVRKAELMFKDCLPIAQQLNFVS